MEAKRRCSEMVYENLSRRSWPCERNATVEEDGKPWCGQHSPSAKRARAVKSQERWNAKFEPQRKAQAERERLAQEHAEMKALLERIAQDEVLNDAAQAHSPECLSMGNKVPRIALEIAAALEEREFKPPNCTCGGSLISQTRALLAKIGEGE